ncbi:MAG: hypothetical protein KZQ63_05890 [Candidatus Thiodiazotropha sp. (ex Lucinoma aequizonata)]|nr:hypothetical protein [Candidatus Thiodiazotropha sp. (ex Lucinoma aequizonata)]
MVDWDVPKSFTRSKRRLMSSIAMFSRNALRTFSMARKDVMYDLLKREEINWRALI